MKTKVKFTNKVVTNGDIYVDVDYTTDNERHHFKKVKLDPKPVFLGMRRQLLYSWDLLSNRNWVIDTEKEYKFPFKITQFINAEGKCRSLTLRPADKKVVETKTIEGQTVVVVIDVPVQERTFIEEILLKIK